MIHLKVQTIVSRPFLQNSYVIWNPDASLVSGQIPAIVIDPGMEPETIIEIIQKNNLKLQGILLTHGHADHIAGVPTLKSKFPECPVYIGSGDASFLTNPELNLSRYYGYELIIPEADRLLTHGEVLDLAQIPMKVWEIPGHSPGHVIFEIAAKRNTVFGGDVLFQGSIGRTDFPYGSFKLLSQGIFRYLWPMADETLVYSGHGQVTTIGDEKKNNPFVGISSETYREYLKSQS